MYFLYAKTLSTHTASENEEHEEVEEKNEKKVHGENRQVENGKSFSLSHSLHVAHFAVMAVEPEMKGEKIKKEVNRQFSSMNYEVLMRKTQLCSPLLTHSLSRFSWCLLLLR